LLQVTAANSLARIISNVPMATFADRHGRRPLLVVGPLIGAGAFALISTATSFQVTTV
jgi:MFS family permease